MDSIIGGNWEGLKKNMPSRRPASSRSQRSSVSRLTHSRSRSPIPWETRIPDPPYVPEEKANVYSPLSKASARTKTNSYQDSRSMSPFSNQRKKVRSKSAGSKPRENTRSLRADNNLQYFIRP